MADVGFELPEAFGERSRSHGLVASASTEGPLRLHVIADDVADVVRSAGGWLCDRARGGWRVTVFLAHARDVTPLEILGARAIAVQTLRGLPDDEGRPHLLAAACGAVTDDQRARPEAMGILKHPKGRLVLWGDDLPPTLDRRFETYRHQLSNAALAFKSHALHAIGEGGSALSPSEEFRGRLKVLGSCDEDLIPTAALRRRSSTVLTKIDAAGLEQDR